MNTEEKDSTYERSEFCCLNSFDDVGNSVGQLGVGLDLDEAVPQEVGEVHVRAFIDGDQIFQLLAEAIL